MKFCVEKLNQDFPIFLIRNFQSINDNLKQKIISIIFECREKNYTGGGGSFDIDKDYEDFFKNMYQQFKNLSRELFGEYNLVEEYLLPHSYCSNKYNYGSIPGRIHNHEDTSTINSVYYLKIPPSVTFEKGSISFFLDEKSFTYKPNTDDLLIFPNYLDHRINNYDDDEEWRISINMEILCEESSDELFDKIKILN